MISQNDFDLIDRFLSGKGDESLKADIEGRLNSDPDFKKAYQDIVELQGSIRELGRDKLKKTIQSIAAKYEAEKSVGGHIIDKRTYFIAAKKIIADKEEEKPVGSRIINFMSRPYSIAALITIFIISSATFFWLNKEDSFKGTPSQYYGSNPNQDTHDSSGNRVPTLEQADKKSNIKSYSEVTKDKSGYITISKIAFYGVIVSAFLLSVISIFFLIRLYRRKRNISGWK